MAKKKDFWASSKIDGKLPAIFYKYNYFNLSKKEGDPRLKAKYLAIGHLAAKTPPHKITKLLNISLSTLISWARSLVKYGIDGLLPRDNLTVKMKDLIIPPKDKIFIYNSKSKYKAKIDQIFSGNFFELAQIEPNPRKKIKLVALGYLQNGYNIQKTSNFIPVSGTHIIKWLRRFLEEGFSGLEDIIPKKSPPNKSLTLSQRKMLINDINKASVNKILTVYDIKEILKEKYKLIYKNNYSIYAMLRRNKVKWHNEKKANLKFDEYDFIKLSKIKANINIKTQLVVLNHIKLKKTLYYISKEMNLPLNYIKNCKDIFYSKGIGHLHMVTTINKFDISKDNVVKIKAILENKIKRMDLNLYTRSQIAEFLKNNFNINFSKYYIPTFLEKLNIIPAELDDCHNRFISEYRLVLHNKLLEAKYSIFNAFPNSKIKEDRLNLLKYLMKGMAIGKASKILKVTRYFAQSNINIFINTNFETYMNSPIPLIYKEDIEKIKLKLIELSTNQHSIFIYEEVSDLLKKDFCISVAKKTLSKLVKALKIPVIILSSADIACIEFANAHDLFNESNSKKENLIVNYLWEGKNIINISIDLKITIEKVFFLLRKLIINFIKNNANFSMVFDKKYFDKLQLNSSVKKTNHENINKNEFAKKDKISKPVIKFPILTNYNFYKLSKQEKNPIVRLNLRIFDYINKNHEIHEIKKFLNTSEYQIKKIYKMVVDFMRNHQNSKLNESEMVERLLSEFRNQ